MTDAGFKARPCVVVCLLLVGGTARAGDRANASLMVYGDSDHVLVFSPTTAGQVTVGPVELGAHVTLDIISAASVDLVTAASPRGYREVRTEAGAGVAWDLTQGGGRRLVSLGYTTSQEPDFRTHQLAVGTSLDLLDRLATLSLGYGFGHSRYGHVDALDDWQARLTHRVDVGWTHVLHRAVTLDVAYGLTILDGAQQSPYRFVRLYAPGAPAGATHTTAVAEAVPDLRLRHTATARVRARLVPHLFLIGDYRFYGDSWGVVGHTGTLRLALGLLDDALTIAVEGRFTHQSAATFYRARYESVTGADARIPEWRTADKELSPLWTTLAGLQLEYTARLGQGHVLRVGAGADAYILGYLDYAYASRRTAFITTFDLTWEH